MTSIDKEIQTYFTVEKTEDIERGQGSYYGDYLTLEEAKKEADRLAKHYSSRFEVREVRPNGNVIEKVYVASDYDMRKAAGPLYGGGWRASDRDMLKADYDLFDHEVDKLCELLQAIEDEMDE